MTESSSRCRHRASVLAAALLGAASAATAVELSEARTRAPSTAPATEALMRAYLDCERSAQTGQLAAADAVACSLIYEELKAEAFGGSYEALKRWYDLQSSGPAGQGA